MVFLSGLAGPSLKVGDDHNSADAPSSGLWHKMVWIIGKTAR